MKEGQQNLSGPILCFIYWATVRCDVYAKHNTIPRYLKFNMFCLISTSDLKLIFSKHFIFCMQPIFTTELTILPSNKIFTGKAHDSNQTVVVRQLLYIILDQTVSTIIV